MAFNAYPRLRIRAFTFLRCSDSSESVNNAILQRRAEELEAAAQEAGIVFAMVRNNEEFRTEPRNRDSDCNHPNWTQQELLSRAPYEQQPGAKSS